MKKILGVCVTGIVGMLLLIFACKRPDSGETQNYSSSLMPKFTPVPLKPAPSGSTVAKYGHLKVVGNKLCDEKGNPVQLKGMSLFWSQYAGSFWTKEVVDRLVDKWNISIIRAAMGIENNGYLVSPETEKEKVRIIVDAAIEKGIYVIIDWHDHDALNHTKEANSFFSEMAQLYGKHPNVLFEIFNEPKDIFWMHVKKYSEGIIKTIRSSGSDNIIIVGTPSWGKDVNIAAELPITKYKNLVYSLHFYAFSHRSRLRQSAEEALAMGLPLFVSEWGTCEANGDGEVSIDENNKWVAFMNKHSLSWCNWSMFNKKEAASALKPDSGPDGKWKLTKSGRYVKKLLLKR